MAPLKKTPTSGATAADAASFFQRGKKPTTEQRIINAKQSPTKDRHDQSKLQRPIKSDDSDDIDNNEEIDDSTTPPRPPSFPSSSSTSSPPSPTLPSSDLPEDSFGDLNTAILDEISVVSWDSDHAVEEIQPSTTSPSPSKIKKKLSILPKELTDYKAQSSRRPIKRSRSRAQIDDGIHQSDLTEDEKLLRQFDLASKYGPSTDLTRLERWERASLLGLDPPQDIKNMVVSNKALNIPVFASRV
ncbi:hypothetical protein BGZ98_003942 [Dissophora globulifera]|nr:hypothetical protein BGZ98_003942 [Dissophora globulifera]